MFPFKNSLPPQTHPPKKQPNCVPQPAFVSGATPSSRQLPPRKAPYGLVCSSHGEGGLLSAVGGAGAGVPKGSGSPSERAPGSPGAARTLLFSDIVPPKSATLPRFPFCSLGDWFRRLQAYLTCGTECGAKCQTSQSPGLGDAATGTGRGAVSDPTAVIWMAFSVQRL